MADLSVKIAGVEFPNPVIAASGTYGNGECFTDLYPLSRLGGISCKGMTIVPKMGNVPPRIAETPSGILNSEHRRSRLHRVLPPDAERGGQCHHRERCGRHNRRLHRGCGGA